MTLLGFIKDMARQERQRAQEREKRSIRIETYRAPMIGTQIKNRR